MRGGRQNRNQTRTVESLSARERQILEVVHSLGDASARQIQSGIPDPPSYSAVRRLIGILEEKGFLNHREEGGRYRYAATTPASEAGVSALQKLVKTFFDDSLEKALATFLSSRETELDDSELQRLSRLIDEARAKELSAREAAGNDRTEAG